MDSPLTRHPVFLVLFELLKLAAISVIGIFVYALSFQLLVSTGLLAADMDGEGYGLALTRQAVMVWAGAIVLGFIAAFIKASWRWPLTLAPLYAPALYALIIAAAA